MVSRSRAYFCRRRGRNACKGIFIQRRALDINCSTRTGTHTRGGSNKLTHRRVDSSLPLHATRALDDKARVSREGPSRRNYKNPAAILTCNTPSRLWRLLALMEDAPLDAFHDVTSRLRSRRSGRKECGLDQIEWTFGSALWSAEKNTFLRKPLGDSTRLDGDRRFCVFGREIISRVQSRPFFAFISDHRQRCSLLLPKRVGPERFAEIILSLRSGERARQLLRSPRLSSISFLTWLRYEKTEKLVHIPSTTL